jgi:hypothetical protein
MRLVLAAVFLFTTSWAVPVGYVEIQTDSAPSQVFLDRQLVVMDSETVVAEAQPGKHFVSFYPPRKVFLAFKDEVPEKFWEPLREAQALGGERDLLSSYERGAVKVGTKWIYVAPEDTVLVRLSHEKVKETYGKDSSCLLGTFVGWTVLLGGGMIISVLLANLD